MNPEELRRKALLMALEEDQLEGGWDEDEGDDDLDAFNIPVESAPYREPATDIDREIADIRNQIVMARDPHTRNRLEVHLQNLRKQR